MQLQRACHDTLPWLISFSLDVSHARAILSKGDIYARHYN